VYAPYPKPAGTPQHPKFISEVPRNVLLKPKGSGVVSRNERVHADYPQMSSGGLYQTELQAVKKSRRLRKNFDVLATALKNSKTTKKEKKINFSGERGRPQQQQ